MPTTGSTRDSVPPEPARLAAGRARTRLRRLPGNSPEPFSCPVRMFPRSALPDPMAAQSGLRNPRRSVNLPRIDFNRLPGAQGRENPAEHRQGCPNLGLDRPLGPHADGMPSSHDPASGSFGRRVHKAVSAQPAQRPPGESPRWDAPSKRFRLRNCRPSRRSANQHCVRSGSFAANTARPPSRRVQANTPE